jgi:hypothetical protein
MNPPVPPGTDRTVNLGGQRRSLAGRLLKKARGDGVFAGTLFG